VRLSAYFSSSAAIVYHSDFFGMTFRQLFAGSALAFH
jgi:hypothetical protein